MTADKKPRRRLTRAVKLERKAARIEGLRAKLSKIEAEYADDLKEAHKEAAAIAASLPPLDVD